jgi:hypothetical protein
MVARRTAAAFAVDEGATMTSAEGAGARTARLDAVAVATAGLLLLLTGGAYLGVTWARAEEVCAQEAVESGDGRAAVGIVAVDWSWRPVGIRCSWDDGTRTSLWWGSPSR